MRRACRRAATLPRMTDQPPPSSSPRPDDSGAPPPPPPLAPYIQGAGASPDPATGAPGTSQAGTGDPAGTYAAGDVQAAPPPPPPPPAQPTGSKLRPIITVGIIVAFIAVVLFLVRDQQNAGDLAVGTCFDVPTRTEDISTVQTHPCTEPHDGEVFHVAEYTGDSYPISLSVESFIEDTCLPAFATFVGATYEDAEELDVGWFYPNREGWDGGDRTFTCYLFRVDEGKISKSMQGSGGT